MCVTWPAYGILFDFIYIAKSKTSEFLTMELSQVSRYFFSLIQNFSSAAHCQTHWICCSLYVTEQMAHTFKITKIKYSCILVYMDLERRHEDRGFQLNIGKQ
jgi:hypothetical protein